MTDFPPDGQVPFPDVVEDGVLCVLGQLDPALCDKIVPPGKRGRPRLFCKNAHRAMYRLLMQRRAVARIRAALFEFSQAIQELNDVLELLDSKPRQSRKRLETARPVQPNPVESDNERTNP